MKKNVVEVITPQFKYFDFDILQSKVHVLVDTLNVGCFFKEIAQEEVGAESSEIDDEKSALPVLQQHRGGAMER